jgi:ferredoxin
LGSAGPELDALACKGCGLCEPACPTGAFQLKESENLLPKLGEGRIAALTCAAGTDEEAVKVPCLAGLSPETLAAAASGRSLLLSVPDTCTACQVGVAPRLDGLMEAAVRILVAFGLTGTVQMVHSTAERQRETAKANQMDRRQFLSLTRLGLVAAARAVMRPEREPAALQDPAAGVVSTGRRQLLSVLRKQPASLAAAAPAAGVPFGAATLVSEGCNGCEACTQSCPTGALALVRRGEADRLTFAADRCAACGLCAQACPGGLLSLAGTFSPAAVARGDSADLVTLPVAACQRCHRRYHGTGDSCPECAKVSWMRSAIVQLR